MPCLETEASRTGEYALFGHSNQDLGFGLDGFDGFFFEPNMGRSLVLG